MLRKYELSVIQKADVCISVSQKDVSYWHQHGADNVKYLPVFTSWNKVVSKEGKGDYCLYHGNLGVAENEKAAMWLIKEVFPKLADNLFVIAGKNPSARLTKEVGKHQNITIVPNPSDQEMEQLISNAHIHLLPSFTNSGIKLKLLHALFCGRFCIVNTAMVKDTGLESICIVADSAVDFIRSVELCLKENFSSQIREREKLLQEHLNNKKNAFALANLL